MRRPASGNLSGRAPVEFIPGACLGVLPSHKTRPMKFSAKAGKRTVLQNQLDKNRLTNMPEGDISSEVLRVSGDLRIEIGRIARRLRQLYGSGEATFSEISVLARLDRQGHASPGALAAAESVRPQAMGATLGDLEQRGLIARSPDPSDGRRMFIALTDAGGQVLEDQGRAVTECLARALADGLSPAEQRQLMATVPLLARIAELL